MIRSSTWFVLLSLLISNGALAASARALPPEEINSGLKGLDIQPGSQLFMMDDQFRFEYGDAYFLRKDRNCRQQRDGNEDERCYGRVPVVPEPSNFVLTGVGIVVLFGLRLAGRWATPKSKDTPAGSATQL